MKRFDSFWWFVWVIGIIMLTVIISSIEINSPFLPTIIGGVWSGFWYFITNDD